MTSLTTTSVLDNSQNQLNHSLAQSPPSPYHPLHNTTNNNTMTTMSAPPTPVLAPPLSLYYNGSLHNASLPPGSNYSQASPSLGQHSGHAPNRRIIMKQSHQKPSSSRAVMMNDKQHEASYLSPVGHTHRPSRRQSLVGFDPLLSGTASNTSTPSKRVSVPDNVTMSAPYHHSKRISPPFPMGMSPSAPPFSRTAPPSPQVTKQSLTPPMKRTSEKKKHRRDVQSFCMSDLRSISQDAVEKEGMILQPEKRSNPNSREGSPSPEKPEARTPPTPVKQEVPRQVSPKRDSKKTAPHKKGPFTISMDKRETGSPQKVSSKDNKSPKQESAKDSKKDTRSSMTPPRKLPWAKKGHRRTRSLESKEIPPAAQKAVKESCRGSVSNAPTPVSGQKKSSMYPGIVADLMELKFDKLQLPSLAKPSPTSFLTGKEDEVVRTCEFEAAPFQIEIPTLPEFVIAARLCEFVENYRRVDQNFDLQQWVGHSRMDLRQVKIPQHIPISQSLLECGEDVTLQGAIAKGTNADDRLEVVVFEGQREFIAVFRGSTEQQSKPGHKTKKRAVPLDAEHESIEVYQCFLEEYMKIEKDCFELMDKLTEQHPFCDLVFTGVSFGAAMATLAAFRYANARPMMRVSCRTLASPKVGFSPFRQMVNSLPNLKVMRLEFGQDAKCQLPSVGGSHVGHTLVLRGSLGHNSQKSNHPVVAYKFDTPKLKTFKNTHPDLSGYVTALEEVLRLRLPWAKEFVGTGHGVVVNNVTRLVV